MTRFFRFFSARSAFWSLSVFSAYFSIFYALKEHAQPSGSHSLSRAVIDLLNYRVPGLDDVLFLGYDMMHNARKVDNYANI